MDKKPEEREFLEHFNNSSLRSRKFTGLLAIVIYDLYGIRDWLIAPNNYKTLWSIRFAMTVMGLIALKILGTDYGRRHMRVILFATALAGLLSVTWIWSISFPHEMSLQVAGPTLTLLFVMSSWRLLPREAITLGLCFVGSFFILLLSRDVPRQVWLEYSSGFIVSFALGLAGSMYVESYARRAYHDEKLLKEETDRADNLLVKIFPFEVARDLKFNNKSIARRSNEVTVMFCDIVGFTEASSQMEPEELLNWLNTTFSEFDRQTAQFGCEKIKTIGDAYMAVSGVPNPAPDHAERIVRLGLSINASIENLTLNNKPLRLRIGIHSGPVIAGVIGESRFAYDLWGDTVNTASRMEALAPVGSIQITKETLEATAGKFKTERQAPIAVKGKGLMETWLVTGIQETAGNTAPEAAEKTAQEAAA